jgi:dipeptidase
MRKKESISFGILLWFGIPMALGWGAAQACTSLLVTKGASADGSVQITYTCDSAGLYAKLEILPAADHRPGATIDLGPLGKIPQVAHTYKVLGVEGLGLMNEHQLAMSETTFGGRKELVNPKGLFDYPRLMTLGLQRARTAREAIRVMTDLVAAHGYRDVGESISIADGNEAWILEIVGPGPGGKGAIWVARRVPDGHISCHANQARIGEFPRNDPANCLFSSNVESFAVSKGWYNPRAGRSFSFFEAYGPPTPGSRRYCDMRVWSILRRAAPSQKFTADYLHCKPGAQPYPFSVIPDAKLSVADVFALMRDQYEGTEFDMTKGIDAGPYGLPRRWRPLAWKVDGQEYGWMRPISTQQTAFSIVSQSRARLPNPIGGLLWYGMDDSFTTCYVPLYCGIEAVPQSFATGTVARFSWDSAWWIFNLVSNYAYLKWSHMIPEIQAAQKDIEGHLLALQPAVEKTAVELASANPKLLTRYLTDYSVMHGEQTVTRWRALGEHLITKYNDGYVRDEKGHYPDIGYPEAWLRRVLREHPNQFKLPVEKPKPGEKKAK